MGLFNIFGEKKKEKEDVKEITVTAKGTPAKKAADDKPLPKEEASATTGITVTTQGTPATKAADMPLEKVTPKEVGTLDMVIAFDTTGSMADYIKDVRRQVVELIPILFNNNENMRLGIVAFGDYCDMENAYEYGKAYQVIQPTDNQNDLVRFVLHSRNTSGGDHDEFYELVLKKIIDETPWRKNASKVIILISDDVPHPLGYRCMPYVKDNQIDWRNEAKRAAAMGIRIDTVAIGYHKWYEELSAMTNGVSIPFHSSYKTARMIRAAAYARGSKAARSRFDMDYDRAMDDDDEEMKAIYRRYRREREDIEF